MAGELTTQDLFGSGVHAATAGKPTSGKSAAAPAGRLSTKDLFGEKQPSMLDRAKEIIPVADTVLGFPAFVAQMGMTGAADIAAVASGDQHPLETGSKIVAKAMQTPWMKFMAKPIQSMTQANTSDTTMEKVGQHISSVIEDAANYWTQRTGNPEMGEAVKQGAAIAMAKGGELVGQVVKAGARTIRGRNVGTDNGVSKSGDVLQPHPTADNAESGGSRTDTGAQPEPTHGTLFGRDAQINAEAQAHKLVNGGADLRTVLAARKKNPLVGKALDDIMARRQEVRTGPMAETLQGEVLPPEEARAVVAAEHPEPHDYANVVEGRVQERVKQLEDMSEGKVTTPAIPFKAGMVLTPVEGAKVPTYTTPTKSLGDITVEVHSRFGEHPDTIIAKDAAGKKVGELQAAPTEGYEIKPGQQSRASDTYVYPEARRQGVATAMYKAAKEHVPGFTAEHIEGKTIRTDEGQAWAKARSKEIGSVDPKLLARIAAAGLGIGAGMYLDKHNKVEGAILGALGGLALSRINPRQTVDFLKKINAPDTRTRIDNIADKREYDMKAAEIVNHHLRKSISELVPDAKRRNAISHWIEGDKTIKLSPDELKAAKLAQDFFTGMKNAGFDSGVLKNARENYVTHIWEWGLQGKSKIEQALARKMQGAGMGTKSPYAKERTISTLAEGKALGLTPKTEDIGEIVEAYGNSMARAIANKNFMEGLKNGKTLDGMPLVATADKAPHTYVSINHPQLGNVRVHPDIAPSMEFLFDQHTPSVAGRALDAFNTALKRMAVSFSLFHNKALVDAMLGASNNPLTAIGKLKGFVTGKDAYLKELNEEGLTPLIQKAVKGGLTFTLDKGPLASEDVGGAFYGAMSDVQGMLDQIVPHGGLPVKGMIKLNHAVDTLTWARMHTGMKLNLFAEKLESLVTNNAKAHEANPDKVALFKEGEAEKIAASFANDIFGGLNWRRVAESVKSAWGRDLALGALKPSSRRLLQLFMFAPDWTLSTVRAMTGAFGKGGGVKGLVNPRTLPDLHRQYVLRSAVYYLIIGDAINHALSGHHLWQNKDMTRIDLGDGRTMQWSKHTMEPIHWLMNPRQQALNKLGTLPRQAGEQALQVEYLSAKGKMPAMKENWMKHLVKGISPIAVQQNFDAGSSAGIAGFLGAPIYGKTKAQQIDDRIKHRLESSTPETREEARKKRMQKLLGG